MASFDSNLQCAAIQSVIALGYPGRITGSDGPDAEERLDGLVGDWTAVFSVFPIFKLTHYPPISPSNMVCFP